jgi:hypothetical protein
MRPVLPATLLGVSLALALPADHRAQAFLDQGVFLITRDGVEIGREEFAIRTTPGGQGRGAVLAVATARYRDREIKTALELSNAHVPISYQLDVTASGRLVERLAGQFGQGRCAIRVVSPRGEVAREFPVPQGAVILDDDAFDQYSFVPHADSGAPAQVMLLRPRQTTVVAAAVRSLGLDTIVVGDRAAAAQHYVITLPGHDRREFWVTPSGDLLKVALQASSVTATRLTFPVR